MGCNSSSQSQADMERRVKQQAAQISNLQKTNEELKQALDRILAENEKARQQEQEAEKVQKKVKELEDKVVAMESQIVHKRDSDDTLNRDSGEDSPPAILLGSETLEVISREEKRVSNAILEDPSIKEIYDRKREMFQKKMIRASEPQNANPPTLASTSMTTKQP